MKVMREEITNTEEIKTSTQENDLSKIKIRHILAQRFKKYGLKKIIGILLLAAVFFCGGVLTDRLILRHGAGKRFYGKPGIRRNMPWNFNGSRSFRYNGRNRTQLPPSNNTPSQNQSQGSTQTAPQPKQ